MKNFTFLLFMPFLLLGCKVNDGSNQAEAPSNTVAKPLFETEYTSHTEFEALEGYEKVSDTMVYNESFHPQFSLLELRKGPKTILVFNKFSIDDSTEPIENIDVIERKILDTIHIYSLMPNQEVIAGSCTDDEKYPEELVAIIIKTEELYAENISRAWRANPETGKFEEIFDLKKIECMNKHHKIDLPKSEF